VGVESVHSTGQILGALAMIAASAGYAASGFVVKGRYGRLTAMQTTFVSMSTASLLALPGAIATAPHELPGLRAAAAVLCLGAIGTAVAFVVVYKLMVEVGPARASLVSYLAPGVALVYGALLLGEPITVAAIGGPAPILAGVSVASRPRRRSTLEEALDGRPLGGVVDGDGRLAVAELGEAGGPQDLTVCAAAQQRGSGDPE
jgi:drug/metabolite transporter (DMT)-like permease